MDLEPTGKATPIASLIREFDSSQNLHEREIIQVREQTQKLFLKKIIIK